MQDMPCEQASLVVRINRAVATGFHPHDVASVAFGDDGHAAAVMAGCSVYEHACQIDVLVSHQVNAYIVRVTTLYICTDEIKAMPWADERTGVGVVVTAGVG